MSGVQVENGFTEEAHPEIFDTRAMPAQPKEKKPGQQPDHIIQQYFENVSSFSLKIALSSRFPNLIVSQFWFLAILWKNGA